MSMRIMVDGFNLALEKGTGVATYARNLTYSLHEMGHEAHVLYGMRRAAGDSSLMKEIAFFDENAGARSGRFQRALRVAGAMLNPFARPICPVPLSGAVIYRQFASRLPYFDRLWNAPHLYEHGPLFFRLHGRRLTAAAPDGASIAHWTYPLPIKARGTANIYTMHDLAPLRLPYTTLDRKQDYFKLVSHLARRADHIVTVSETSKKDIMNLLGVPEEKITNTYQTAALPKASLSLPIDTLRDELSGTFRIDYKNYFLYYGSIEPKKNIGRIIEAYLASNVAMPLVIVGAQAWKADQELKLLKLAAPVSRCGDGREGAAAASGKGKVIQLEYVTISQLTNLVRGALAVTFPSLYEGFGLPILESMLCGTPVITSNIGAMAEIAGDAAILVDPYDVRDLKNAMIAASANPNLCAGVVARGAVVARRYSPEAYQQRLQVMYTRVKATGRGIQ
jgi:glycosyltransferase involved in cell wall biosynthesis